MARSLPLHDPLHVDDDRVAEVGARLAEVEERFHDLITGPVAARAGSWRAALTNLRLSRRYDLDVLEPEALTLDDEDAVSPACGQCEDPCCADPLNETTLRLIDLWVLREAGLEAAVVDPPLHGGELADLEARDSYRRFPTLAKRDDGACVFFGDDHRCRIYAVRPRQCRRFPHRLDDDRSAVTWNARCPERGEALSVPERAALKQQVADDDLTKVRDLVTLVHGAGALALTELEALLPDDDSRSGRR